MMIKLLEKLPSAQCPKLIHRVVDGVCGQSGPRRTDYGERWSLTEWVELMNALSSFIRFGVGRGCSDQEIQELLSDLDTARAEALLQCVRSRFDEIRYALVDRTNGISSTQLQDFNWQLKLALSSDKLSALNTPLLNLSLDLKENGIQRLVNIEMNKEELHTLISALEAANKVVLQLKLRYQTKIVL
ncbi:COMM domain-containing protein 8-like [Sinocyclocheilus rhinocerous]|uniref:COMM domain-containing protein 8-like n=1 Tax=Sinocyclocheilus rhinocerous TaxID=307959 RepID=A0A673IWX4_9TELE|nr:PREDICTED: COMM domain-containing protein 8-like [Sinocyclocheilus rhinocerous]